LGISAEQARQQLVGEDVRNELGCVRAHHLHDARQPLAVQLSEKLQQLDRLLEDARIRSCTQFCEPPLDLLADLLLVDH